MKGFAIAGIPGNVSRILANISSKLPFLRKEKRERTKGDPGNETSQKFVKITQIIYFLTGLTRRNGVRIIQTRLFSTSQTISHAALWGAACVSIAGPDEAGNTRGVLSGASLRQERE